MTLDALGDSIRLLEQMQNQVPQVERQFEPLQDQFNMLDKHEVTIPEEVGTRLTKCTIIYCVCLNCLLRLRSSLLGCTVVGCPFNNVLSTVRLCSGHTRFTSVHFCHIFIVVIFLSQEKFRSDLLHSSEDFKKTVSTLAEDFETNGPFTDQVSVEEALQYIANMRQNLNSLKEKEDNIRRGLNIFKIDQPPSHLIVSLEKVSCWNEQIRVSECVRE